MALPTILDLLFFNLNAYGIVAIVIAVIGLLVIVFAPAAWRVGGLLILAGVVVFILSNLVEGILRSTELMILGGATVVALAIIFWDKLFGGQSEGGIFG